MAQPVQERAATSPSCPCCVQSGCWPWLWPPWPVTAGQSPNSTQGGQWPGCPWLRAGQGREGMQWEKNPLLLNPHCSLPGSGIGLMFDSNYIKQVPIPLFSAELHPQPLLCCRVGARQPPCWSLHWHCFLAWLCLFCGVGISLSCMWLCMRLHPQDESISVQLSPAPVCVYTRQQEGREQHTYSL